MSERWSHSPSQRGRGIFLDAYCEVRPDDRGTPFALYEALSVAMRALAVT